MDDRRIDADMVSLFEGDPWLVFQLKWFSHAVVGKAAILFYRACHQNVPSWLGRPCSARQCLGPSYRNAGRSRDVRLSCWSVRGLYFQESAKP